jgi:quercetin dioxygenase-like cupin family protein
VLSVLTGQLALRVGAVDHTLDTGDTVLFQAHAPHRYACAGDEPVRFVMVVLQPGDAGLVPPTAIAEADPPSQPSPRFRDGESPFP